MADVLGVFVVGLMAGTLGGLLGIGGGIILMPFLRFYLDLPPAYAAGTCIVAVFCTTLSGSLRHYKLGHVDLRSIVPIITTGALTTAVFSFAFLWLAKHDRYLDLGTGLVFSLIATRMIVAGLFDITGSKAERVSTSRVHAPLLHKLAIGTAGGVLPGLLGIGTGGIMVPAFTLILKAPIKTAIGCSLACFSANALVSATCKCAQGFVSFTVAGPACAGTLLGAYLGATLNRKFPSAALKILFGAVFAYVSLKFVLSSAGIRI
ncbi:MAG: sulfite exporter TauE/SafE family protein [Phycisphaerales bacterium]|nr:sulfite exporter TauE/SafE family protein [Phycisphaerales bacterium]